MVRFCLLGDDRADFLLANEEDSITITPSPGNACPSFAGIPISHYDKHGQNIETELIFAGSQCPLSRTAVFINGKQLKGIPVPCKRKNCSCCGVVRLRQHGVALLRFSLAGGVVYTDTIHKNLRQGFHKRVKRANAEVKWFPHGDLVTYFSSYPRGIGLNTLQLAKQMEVAYARTVGSGQQVRGTNGWKMSIPTYPKSQQWKFLGLAGMALSAQEKVFQRVCPTKHPVMKKEKVWGIFLDDPQQQETLIEGLRILTPAKLAEARARRAVSDRLVADTRVNISHSTVHS